MKPKNVESAIECPRNISAGLRGGLSFWNGEELCARHAQIAMSVKFSGFILYCADWNFMNASMRPWTFSQIPLDLAHPADMVIFFMFKRFAVSLHSVLSKSGPLSDKMALGTPNLTIISSRNIFAAYLAVIFLGTALHIRKCE